MKLKVGRSYRVDNSVLKVHVLRIFHEDDSIIVMKLALIDLSDELVETPRQYRVQKSNIQHWRIV